MSEEAEVQEIMNNEGVVESESNSEIVVEPESTPEEPESTPEEPESTPESTPEEPESTPESTPEEPAQEEPEEITEEEKEQRKKSINQRIAELEYLVELAGQWASREINRDRFIELWENRNVSANVSSDYESKLSEFEKMPEIIQKWNQGLNMRRQNHFKNLAGYSLEKRLFSDDTSVEEKVTTLEKLETLLVKCAKLEYSGKIGELNDYIDSFY